MGQEDQRFKSPKKLCKGRDIEELYTLITLTLEERNLFIIERNKIVDSNLFKKPKNKESKRLKSNSKNTRVLLSQVNQRVSMHLSKHVTLMLSAATMIIILVLLICHKKTGKNILLRLLL
jgi:hypothetical protein